MVVFRGDDVNDGSPVTAMVFFHRYCTELRHLTRLSLPLILAQVAHMAMGFVDTVMAGRVSPADLAAVAIGSSIWFPVFLFAGGVLMAVTPIVAQHFGAGNVSAIPSALRQGLWIALLLGIGGFFLLRHVEWILDLLELEEDVQRLAVGYLNAIAWGLPALALYQALRSFSEGVSITRPIMVIGFIGLAFNVPANYILIYGKLGFPAMGGVGCGWASALVMWVMLATMTWFVWRSRGYRFLPSLLLWEYPNLRSLWRIILLGFPIGMSIFIETSMFAVIALLVASLGAEVVAGHQIALNFTSLLFMVPLSISMAITIRVGQALGARQGQAARFSAFAGVLTTLVTALLFSTMIMLFSPQIAALYSPDPRVQSIAVSLLFFAALFQISDAVQVSAAGGLRGYKDTRVPMVITFIAFWVIGLPLGVLLGISSWAGIHMGAQGFWTGLVAGLSCAALLQGWRLWSVGRRNLSL
ncbi:MATE family efflux transporter [Desulfurispirillum indicum]|uniref:MATE family efflux transporter n=1 Tax=Desulfurispirillum indicum TaxID=936456 RepID=UPI001CF9DAA9|nr:MATE family efflux transporter [Desulfurispirillum indicum]UCZ55653.1 MATE family efflux transporter [Desulfurispirillum indicum]